MAYFKQVLACQDIRFPKKKQHSYYHYSAEVGASGKTQLKSNIQKKKKKKKKKMKINIRLD